ncbi:MAG TPA: prephenate dehydratase domain-containing protein [Candidatus Methanomethylophilaceae archaeon]|jgi:prephenate dehydratase|nr:prephenate dehydratase domain-containing protein [Candidatus Methanomethylophilaceae archaeon]
MKKIGYMGIPFSNSENAARKFIEKRGINGELIPLVNSEGVVRALLEDTIDYGIVAVRNAVAGKVIETEEALKLGPVKVIEEIGLSIHHCVFIKREGIKVSAVASHIQALAQTHNNLDEILPGIKKITTEDTALSAEMLADGRLPEDTAVICGLEAGRNKGLFLLKENIEDDKENMTYFALLVNS